MELIKTLHDNSGNTATIEKWKTLPYNGAKKKTDAYRLSLYASYDNNFLYHVSTYESMEELENGLSRFSCGTFK